MAGDPDTVRRLQDELAELRRSRRRLADSAWTDRRAIERELHDGVQQHLVALAVDVRRLAGLVDGDPSAARALLDEVAAVVQLALHEAAELAQRVYPPLLEARGFASAVRTAAERSGLTVLVDAPAAAGYPPGIIAAIYWSCVEALAAASPGSQAVVSVRDTVDGVTFELAIAGQLSEAQLDRLHDRTEALDGQVSVEPQDGGSRVQGWLPRSP